MNPRYHHGDLPAALVRAAMEMLAEDGSVDLSLRAVARRAGVSTAAPYRHFPDRMALLSAIAAVGYRELMTELATHHPTPSTVADIADLGVIYVCFALSRPGLFRVMFAEGCDKTSPDRVAAVAAVNAYLQAAAQRIYPGAEADTLATLATGTWSLVHGLAFLYLDGKLDAASDDELADRVRRTVATMLSVST